MATQPSLPHSEIPNYNNLALRFDVRYGSLADMCAEFV